MLASFWWQPQTLTSWNGNNRLVKHTRKWLLDCLIDSKMESFSIANTFALNPSVISPFETWKSSTILASIAFAYVPRQRACLATPRFAAPRAVLLVTVWTAAVRSWSCCHDEASLWPPNEWPVRNIRRNSPNPCCHVRCGTWWKKYWFNQGVLHTMPICAVV